jgi:hypothetical protein
MITEDFSFLILNEISNIKLYKTNENFKKNRYILFKNNINEREIFKKSYLFIMKGLIENQLGISIYKLFDFNKRE